jgi:hypothetical protein
MRIAAHARTDRWNTDFIASLPKQPLWLRLLFIFVSFEKKLGGGW